LSVGRVTKSSLAPILEKKSPMLPKKKVLSLPL
jgi:hypothetical protein